MTSFLFAPRPPAAWLPSFVRPGLALLGSTAAGAAASPASLTAYDDEIHDLVAQMTLAEKAGQMTQPNFKALSDLREIETLQLGSVLSGGSSDPATGNTLADWANLYATCQDHALASRLGIPLLYGIDAVHGHNNVLGAVIFPHNIGLGATRNPDLVEQVSRVTAREMRATGIQWTFAPCVAVPRDLRWGRTYEGYSEDPDLVARLGAAAVRGLQGTSLAAPDAVVACAKHYVADGGTTDTTGSGRLLLDQGDARIDEATLRAIHLPGFTAAIDAGVATIMPAFSSWNGNKVSGSHYLLTELLKEELGFEGFVVSDYNAIDQLVAAMPSHSTADGENASGQVRSADYKRCVELAINAGMDMVMLTDRYPDFIAFVQELVQEGKIPLSRIDDAVTRILRVKFAHGMMAGQTSLRPSPELQEAFGSVAHRAVAREAVRQSVVLLRNTGGILPLSDQSGRIHVMGRGADNIGMQCGGWTIAWQGALGPVTTGGTSLLTAFRDRAGDALQITDPSTHASPVGADLAVVVIGEAPYAEGHGDRADLGLSEEDLAAFAVAREAGIPVVVVLLSGRPLILGEVAAKADAIVAAWLPGTEGQGVVDVLFGDVAPTGRLPFTWPRTMAQLPRGHDPSPPAEPLFPLGFGLGYP